MDLISPKSYQLQPNKIIMSNIRDLQKLRGTKNISVFAQTAYHHNLNPQTKKAFYDHFLERSPVLTTRSPRKQYKQSEDHSKSPSRLHVHRRGGSFGIGSLHQQKNSVIFQNPRVSMQVTPLHSYNVSMKLSQPKTTRQFQAYDSPSQERKDKDTFFQMNQITLTRKKSSQPNSPSKRPEISRKNFTVLYPIGKGGFGKVWKVQQKKARSIYAMKEMSKVKIINKKSVSSVMNQKQFLSRLNHPFLVNIKYAFQDRQHLYLIMDYLDGGDLRYHLGNKRVFNQRQTKFFISNIIIGLEYMHKNKIIHRDIKPQNLVLDSQGYMRVTDLGISRQYRQNNSNDTSGTPGYMAPEVMCRKDHSFTVDYFALGVIGYEFMLGRRPYYGKDRKQIKQNMLAKQAQVRIDQLPYKWSPHSIDFINRLLLRNPSARLGATGIDEIKEHPWLQDVEWDRLLAKRARAPFRPISIEEDYESYKEQISQDTVIDNQEETLLMLRNKQTQTIFDGYYYERTDPREKRTTSHATHYSTNYTEQNFKRR